MTTLKLKQNSDARQIARLGLLFLCGSAPRSAIMAQHKLATIFGVDIPESLLREAQLDLLAEAVSGLGEIAGRKSS